jgi:hypothetical protein
MEEVFVYCFTVCWGFAVPSHLIVDQMISTMKIIQTQCGTYVRSTKYK